MRSCVQQQGKSPFNYLKEPETDLADGSSVAEARAGRGVPGGPRKSNRIESWFAVVICNRSRLLQDGIVSEHSRGCCKNFNHPEAVGFFSQSKMNGGMILHLENRPPS